MNELSAKMQKCINCYKPIETEGLVLYPFKTANYTEYAIARQAIGFTHQTLPFEYLSMPLLSAFYKIDIDHVARGESATGLFSAALIGIALALRLNRSEDEDGMEMIKRITVLHDLNDRTKLKGVLFVVDGIEEVVITPIQYERLRPIIAAQNGIEIRGVDENPELIEAEEKLAAAHAPKLNFDSAQLVHAAAALTGRTEEEIYEWPILKLMDRLNSFKKVIDYAICGIGESQGTKWKSGNPHPNPWLERIKGDTGALISMDGFMGGAGLQAMKDAGALDD